MSLCVLFDGEYLIHWWLSTGLGQEHSGIEPSGSPLIFGSPTLSYIHSTEGDLSALFSKFKLN